MRHNHSVLSRGWPLLSALLLCAGFAGAAHAACDGLTVTDAWVPAAPPGVTAMAGYFEATNATDAAIELTAVSSPQFDRAHMHRSVVDDSGMASMQPVDTVTLAPGETVTFGPGGYHVMLFDPVDTLEPGDSVTLALHCGDPESSLTVAAELRKRTPMEARTGHGDMGHDDMQHDMDHGQMHMAHDTDHEMGHDTGHDHTHDGG